MFLKNVRFLVDKEPTGDLAARRKHARRVTPYPSQMQALIDANLLTADSYEEHRERRGQEQDTRDDETTRLLIQDKSHRLAQIWEALKKAVGCGRR